MLLIPPIQLFIRIITTHSMFRKETLKILLIEEKLESKFTQLLLKLLRVHRFPASSCLRGFLLPDTLGTYKVAPIF